MEEEKKDRKLSQSVKEYLQMRYDLLRLELLEKLSLIVSLILLIIIGIVFLLSAFLYASIALIFSMRDVWGIVPGFLLMSGVFLVITAVLFVMKDKWFVNPLLKQLSAILFKETNKEEVENGK